MDTRMFRPYLIWELPKIRGGLKGIILGMFRDMHGVTGSSLCQQ